MIPLRLLFFALAASTFAPSAGRAVEIASVRHWAAPDHTRIVADLSGAATFRHRFLDQPPRIVLEIDDGVFRFPTQEMTVDLGRVAAVGTVVPALGVFTTDFPRRLIVETSADGATWLRSSDAA